MKVTITSRDCDKVNQIVPIMQEHLGPVTGLTHLNFLQHQNFLRHKVSSRYPNRLSSYAL